MRSVVIFMFVAMGCDAHLPPYASETELTEPVRFGEFTTSNGIQFSSGGDTLYTSNSISKTFDNGRTYSALFMSTYQDGVWSQPEMIPLDIDAYHPVLSVDHQLFFNSRSHPDSANKSIPHNIWSMHRTADGWSPPEMAEGVNSSSYDSYPSVAANRNLYFNSDRPGGKGGMDFYVSYYQNGYQKPVNLEALNSSDVENDLVVDPLERFIIFNRYIHSTKEIDLYISFNEDGNWSSPRKLDNLNTEKWELTPTLSPDGQYFFYEVDNQIMQIDLSALIYPDELENVGKR